MKLIWIATSISVKCYGWLLPPLVNCCVSVCICKWNGKWQNKNVLLNRNYNCFNREWAKILFLFYFLAKIVNLTFFLSFSAIRFQLTSNFSNGNFSRSLLLNVLWNKTLSYFWCFFHYCFCLLACLSFWIFFLLNFFWCEKKKKKNMKVARGMEIKS